MKFPKTVIPFLCAIVSLLLGSDIILAQHQHNQEHLQETPLKQQWLDLQQQPTGPSLTLAELEQMAVEKNPTIAQAEAAILAAQGRRRQAGLWPNPTIGYRGEEFAFRAFNEKSEHFFTVEQNIPLGGKLAKSRRIFEQEVSQAETNATAQKQRVINTVRLLYYEALAAQQRVAIRSNLAQ